MNKQLLFSYKKQDWETPDDFFSELDDRYHFTLDVCATARNAKCARYFTPEVNGLRQSWQGQRCWMNPPYGREILRWMEKASSEVSMGNCFVAALVPARTDTRWFHRYIYNKYSVTITFLKGRLKFKGAVHPAPFPSMLVIFENPKNQ